MKTALVIEDEHLWKRTFCDLLREYGFKVYSAQDGLEGISKAIKYKPDVIVVDYVLPKVNGSYVIRFIRANPAFENAGIVLTAVNSDMINEHWATEYGANLFIEKENGIENAVKRLRNFLLLNFHTKKDGPIVISDANISTLMEVIDEDLRREKMNREILELVQRVDDERYVMRRLWKLFQKFANVTTFFALLISPSAGRFYGFSNKVFGIDKETILNELHRRFSKPITPSEWLWYGNVRPYKEDDTDNLNLNVFKTVNHREEEQGIIAFEIEKKDDIAKFYAFLKNILESLGILFRTLNVFLDYKTAADVDSLTGLFLKKFIILKLEEHLKLLNRKNVPFSVAMMDIDHFKRINDTYGHVKGDEVLKKIGEIIKSSLREIDIPSRYGGEEFLIIFPGTKLQEAVVAVERILNNVRNYNWKKVGVSKVTMSAGIAEAVKSKTVTEIIEMADSALYKAKNSGRDRFVIYEGGEKDD